jgi:threonylcarbamoyladenosine tRNA methylthiotransferase MtaB
MNRQDISVSVVNHGCRLNQFEGEAIENDFKVSGYKIADMKRGEIPDIAIINTCTVTNRSDRKSRNSIYRAITVKKPFGLVIVTGCYAETNVNVLKAIQGVDFVFGNCEKADIPAFIKSYFKNKSFISTERDSSFLYSDPEYPHRSRVLIKVQDGCNMHCTYCKIPQARGARGKSRSRDYRDIVSYTKKIVKNGYREIVLTGINLGDYNYKGLNLAGLLSRILEINDSFRIRLSSIEPFYFRGDLLRIISDNRIVPHFHIPLQSGSNRILKMMARPYTAEAYIEILKQIESVKPETHFATDVIVGFPTESLNDFKKTLDLINAIPFASLHVFTYSPRDGTGSVSLDNSITACEKTKRSKEVRKRGLWLNYQYRNRFLGSVRDAIFESHNLIRRGTINAWEGITDNYIRVKLIDQRNYDAPFISNLNKKIIPVRITGVERKFTYGEMIEI